MGAARISFSWVDVKLGLRMLRKHAGLTVAAVLALAVGIPVGMAPTQLADVVSAPLPEDPGDRIRVIRYWNVETNQPQSATDFELSEWPRELSGFETLAAYRREPFGYSVSIGDGPAARESGAEVTASMFGILGRPPLLGRTLTSADQRVGAPAVAVVGYDMWQSRLAGDPEVIGRTLRMSGVPHTIVGVMPAGFLFPRHEEFWVPLHTGPVARPDAASTLRLFGRLADGVSTEEAQAQVEALGRRMATEFPESHARLRAEVVRFGTADWNLPKGGIRAWPGFLAIQLLCLVLLLVACANVAMLIFARSVTRFRELSIRAALGAGRTRLVSQMFVECLVLALAATAIGIPAYGWLLRQLQRVIVEGDQTQPTYWLHLGMTPKAALWGVLLAVLSATLVGVFPALQVTGRHLGRGIKEARAGHARTRFGGVTSVLIVADVAITVTAVGFAVGLWGRV